MAALVYAFWLPRGRGRACPARGFPISARLPYTAGPHICGPYTSAIFYHAATANVPGTVKTVPYKAPVNPICRKGLDPSADACLIPGIHRQPPAHPPRGVGDAAPYNDLRAFPPSFTPALFAAWHTPADVPRGTSAGLFCWKNPFFIPSVCVIIDTSGPKAAKKRKNRGGTAWQKSSQ